MQLSVIADKSTWMYNIQIAFSPIPLISTNKLTLIKSLQKIVTLHSTSKNDENAMQGVARLVNQKRAAYRAHTALECNSLFIMLTSKLAASLIVHST